MFNWQSYVLQEGRTSKYRRNGENVLQPKRPYYTLLQNISKEFAAAAYDLVYEVCVLLELLFAMKNALEYTKI